MQSPLDILNSIGQGPMSQGRPPALDNIPKYLGNTGGTFMRNGMEYTRNPVNPNPAYWAAQRGSPPGGGQTLNSFGITPQDLLAALRADASAFQGAADEQWARNNQEIQGARGDIQAGINDIQGGNQYAQNLLGGYADTALSLGDAQYGNIEGAAREARDRTWGQTDDIRAGVSDIQGRQADLYDRTLRGADANYADVIGDVNASYSLMDAAGDEYLNEFVKKFDDRSVQDAAIAANATAEWGMSQMKMARSGLRPDGTRMTAAEQQQAVTGIQQQVGEQVQTAVGQITSSYNQARVGLGETLAGIRQNAAMARQSGAQIKLAAQQTRLQGYSLGAQLTESMMRGEQIKLEAAGLDAQAGQAYADDVQAAEQARASMFQLSASLGTQMAQMAQAAMLSTANLRMQGREMTARLVAANPRSIVGVFESILSLYTAGRAQASTQQPPMIVGGSKKQPGMSFGMDPGAMFGAMPSMKGQFGPSLGNPNYDPQGELMSRKQWGGNTPQGLSVSGPPPWIADGGPMTYDPMGFNTWADLHQGANRGYYSPMPDEL